MKNAETAIEHLDFNPYMTHAACDVFTSRLSRIDIQHLDLLPYFRTLLNTKVKVDPMLIVIRVGGIPLGQKSDRYLGTGMEYWSIIDVLV